MNDDSILTSPSDDRLAWIEQVRADYRKMWTTTLINVPERRFDGDLVDIEALEFIDYEAGYHPHGLAGAAIIWGGVLVATGLVQWAKGEDGRLVLRGREEYPRLYLDPTARTYEVNHSTLVRPGERYQWLIDEAVVRIYATIVDQSDLARLRSIVAMGDGECFQYTKEWLADLSAPPEPGNS